MAPYPLITLASSQCAVTRFSCRGQNKADVAELRRTDGACGPRGGTKLGHIGDELNTSHLFMTRQLPEDAYSTWLVGSDGEITALIHYYSDLARWAAGRRATCTAPIVGTITAAGRMYGNSAGPRRRAKPRARDTCAGAVCSSTTTRPPAHGSRSGCKPISS
jgi:hypothetical protein